MSEKRFELTINPNGQTDIIDKVESKEKNAICIYNDLGVLPFSSAKAVCGLLNEQDTKIKELETRCQHHEHNLKQYQKEKENLTNMIKNQINKINYQEYLSDHDKILAIHQLEGVLSIIDSGANESYSEKIEVVHFGKAIDEICSHLTYPPDEDK